MTQWTQNRSTRRGQNELIEKSDQHVALTSRPIGAGSSGSRDKLRQILAGKGLEAIHDAGVKQE